MSTSRTPVELDFFRMEKENSLKSKLLQPNRSFKGIQGAISKLNPELLKSVINSGSVVVSERKSLEIKQETPAASSGSKDVENSFCFSVPSTPKQNLIPIFNPIPRGSNYETAPPPTETPTAPLTIFYNGTVSVFDVPCTKAEKLMKHAENCKALDLNDPKPIPEICSSSSSCDDGNKLLEKLNGDGGAIKNLRSQIRVSRKLCESISYQVCVSATKFADIDFPIQRRKSLSMFLQKRKARMTLNSPYANSQPMVEKSKESVQV